MLEVGIAHLTNYRELMPMNTQLQTTKQPDLIYPDSNGTGTASEGTGTAATRTRKKAIATTSRKAARVKY